MRRSALTALFAVLDVQTISSTVSITGKRYRTIARRIGPEPGAYRVRRHARLALPDLNHSHPYYRGVDCGGGIPVGDERQLRLLYNRPYPFAVSDVLATVLYCIAVSLLSSLLNAAILVVMLNPALRPMFLTATVITTPLRVMAFAVVMGLIGYIAALSTKRDVPSLGRDSAATCRFAIRRAESGSR